MKLNNTHNLRKLFNLRKNYLYNNELDLFTLANKKLLKIVKKQAHSFNDPLKIPVCTNWNF